MKEIVRLSFILMLISAVAAGSLSYVNQVTSAIISDRGRQEKIALLQQLFPDVVNSEDKTVDGQTATLGFDAAGEVVGVLAQGSTVGYGGEIVFLLAVDGEGKIVSVSVLSHSETPGIGDKIVRPTFLDQFKGKSMTDPLSLDQDIDNITGATFSVGAMTDGVRQALPEVAARFLENQ